VFKNPKAQQVSLAKAFVSKVKGGDRSAAQLRGHRRNIQTD